MENKILNIISIIIGFLYILFILWLRLIRERLPKELTGNYDLYTLILYHLLLLMSLIMFIYYLRQALNIKSKYTLLKKLIEIPSIKKVSDLCAEYILNAPFNLYIWVCNKINIINFIEKIGRHIWERDPYKDPKKIAVILCILKIIISVCFLSDIIIFNKFNYFYKSLFLLLIILVCNAFIFILKDNSKYNRNYITEHFITLEQEKDKFVFIADFQPHFDGDRTEENLYGHYNTWVRYTANCMFADKFYEFYYLYSKYTNVFYYGMYTMGWFYIIYFIK